MAKSQSGIDVFEEAEFVILNLSYYSRLYSLDYIITKLDRKNRRMALNISNNSKQKFEDANIQPPEYIIIKFIEEWELSDSDTLHFDYQLRGGILPKWGPEEELKDNSPLRIGTIINVHLLYQIKMQEFNDPNNCEWRRVGTIKIVEQR